MVKKGKCAECAPHCLRCDTNGPEVLPAVFFFGIFFGLGPSHPDKDKPLLVTGILGGGVEQINCGLLDHHLRFSH